MSYGVIYTVPFKSRKETSYLVEIQKEGYEGEVTELTGNGESPFSVEIDDEEFLYTPTRFSTATIRIVGNDYLQSLYSTGYQQYRVNFKREGVIVWTGFVTPELYTQDYTSTKFVLEIQAVSAMSTLEYISYKKKGENYAFVSLWYLLTRCVKESCGSYSAVYIPHVYADSQEGYENLTNVLDAMKISEQNFFDEDDKAMNLKEIIEELCKCLNWTCADWLGVLYFVDMDHDGEYYKCTPDFSSYTMVEGNELNVQNIGFAGSDHSLDILGGYNKCSVKTSNYNVGDIFPEEDFDTLQLLYAPEDVVVGKKVSVKKFFTPKEYQLFHFLDIEPISGTGPTEPITDLEAFKTHANTMLGAMLIKADDYNMVEKDGVWKPDITDYSFEDLIQVRGRLLLGKYPNEYYLRLSKETELLRFSSKLPTAVYQDGAFGISCQAQISADENLADMGSGLVGTFGDPFEIRCKLSIGDNYWNGELWTTTESYFDITFDSEKIEAGGFVSNDNTKNLSDPYTGLTGYMIPIDRPLYGMLDFHMYTIDWKDYNNMAIERVSMKGYFLKNLQMQYVKLDSLSVDDDSDRIYENVVNESFVNELDEIEHKISSYNGDGLCYSKLLLGDEYLTNNLYSILQKSKVRIEEQLINRIISQYSATKIKLTQILVNDARITPITLLTDKYMTGKKFVVIGGEIDFKLEQFNCKMVENNGRN
jgi:hypothetical protein